MDLVNDKDGPICKEHNQDRYLYCKDDKIAICSDCGFFGKHKGHNIVKIQELRGELTIKKLKDLKLKMENCDI